MNGKSLPPWISCRQLIESYDTLLFDAYGVLVSSKEALPKAVELISYLNHCRKPYFVVTNGSSSSPEQTARRYGELGLAISPDKVISSGALAAAWLQEHQLENARFMILGPPSCHFMVADFPGEVVPFDCEDFDVLVIGNQDGFDLHQTIDHIISALFRAYDRGRQIHLLLPNPDLIFPGPTGSFAITAGMLALMIESALEVRYHQQAPRFVRLGKPYSPIFAEAKRRAGRGSLVMIGDQMQTDIQGALAAEIAAVLIATGLSRIEHPQTYQNFSPTYRMLDLSL